MTKLIDIYLKYDMNFFSWLVTNRMSQELLQKYSYDLQVGVFLKYLYEIHHITIYIRDNKAFLVYHNSKGEELGKPIDIGRDIKNNIVAGYMLAIAHAAKTNFKPF